MIIPGPVRDKGQVLRSILLIACYKAWHLAFLELYIIDIFITYPTLERRVSDLRSTALHTDSEDFQVSPTMAEVR